MDVDQVRHIAGLARLEFTDKELDKFAGEFTDILAFVDQIKTMGTDSDEVVRDMRQHNIRRDDVGPHAAGQSRDEILSGMPAVEADMLRVKKILPN